MRRRLQVFRAARRHSRLVRMLRRGLPVAGVLAIVALAVASRMPAPVDFDFSVARTTVTRNSVVMEHPRLSGFDRSMREYTVTADRATQLLSAPDEVQLERISANLKLPGRGSADIEAGGGAFNNGEGTLDLHGGVDVSSTEGYSLQMAGAAIDMKAGTLVSPSPVRILYQDSETTANRLSVSEGGKIIVLEEQVRTVMMPPKRARPSTEAPPAGQAAGEEH